MCLIDSTVRLVCRIILSTFFDQPTGADFSLLRPRHRTISRGQLEPLPEYQALARASLNDLSRIGLPVLLLEWSPESGRLEKD